LESPGLRLYGRAIYFPFFFAKLAAWLTQRPRLFFRRLIIASPLPAAFQETAAAATILGIPLDEWHELQSEL